MILDRVSLLSTSLMTTPPSTSSTTEAGHPPGGVKIAFVITKEPAAIDKLIKAFFTLVKYLRQIRYRIFEKMKFSLLLASAVSATGNNFRFLDTNYGVLLNKVN